MKKVHAKQMKYMIMILLTLSILAGAPTEFGEDKAFFHGYAIQTPVIRIGLGVNLSDIRVSSSSGMKVYEVNSHYRLLADDEDEVFVKGRKEKLTEKFVIQVFQTKDQEKAEIFAQELRAKVEYNVLVDKNPESEIYGNFQVKVGDFLTRNDALNYIKKLNEIGITDTWVLREEVTEEESKPLWILINDELISLSEDTILYFIPSNPHCYLSFNGRSYRGLFVLRTTSKGIVLINILNLDEYLKSVVPSELSPYTFGELEALKAQAVAARTYALRNLRSNEELGFDLCDSPKSQYYRGMDAEHPLSSKAVESTRGEAALYKGLLINALYTSTCGGMTEDVENIFEGTPVPYLKSTQCIYDKQNEWLLKSRNLVRPIQMNGRNISPDLAYLISLKVIPYETSPDYYGHKASFGEAMGWIKTALDLMGKTSENLSAENSPLNFVTFSHLVVKAFGWNNRVENLLLESERDYVIKDSKSLQADDRNDLAFLIQEGVLPHTEEMGDPQTALTRGELAYYLKKAMDSDRDLSHQAKFKSLGEDKIEVEEEREKKQFALSPDLFLLRNNGGDYSFASHVYLLGGEEVRFLEKEGEIQFLEIIYPPHTNILDRSSSFHRWKIRMSRKAMEKRINQYYPVGQLIDIVPQKRGKSKRVIEILIAGSEGQAVVKGIKIRRVLGLSETLFVIDREYDKGGNVTHFTFCGRGLGHGVGLCQVGAFGMAQTGADYKNILKKYYRGIKISRIY